MKFDRKKVFVGDQTFVIRKTDEVVAALKCKPPSDRVLLKLLISNDQSDVESADKEIRQLAFAELQRRGYSLET